MKYDDELSDREENFLSARKIIENSILWNVQAVFETELSSEIDLRLLPSEKNISWESYYKIADKACKANGWPCTGKNLVNMLGGRAALEQEWKRFLPPSEVKIGLV